MNILFKLNFIKEYLSLDKLDQLITTRSNTRQIIIIIITKPFQQISMEISCKDDCRNEIDFIRDLQVLAPKFKTESISVS